MWKYGKKTIKSLQDTPEGSIGFIYKITNLDNGKFYVGRKSFGSVRNVVVSKKVYDKIKSEGGKVSRTKNKKTKKMVYKKEVRKETDWLTYTGSCKPLNLHIQEGAKIKKEIIQFCYNKKQMTYYEIKAIVCTDCLEIENCYNANLLGKFFPKDLINQ